MLILSYENEVSFKRKLNSFSYERMSTKTRFEEEAKGNSEMAYCCAVTIFEYSTTEVTLPSCLSVPSEHVASQSKWQSADLDLVKLAKKRKSVWPALFLGNVCI